MTRRRRRPGTPRQCPPEARARRGRLVRALTTILLAAVVGMAGPARARPVESTSMPVEAGPAPGDGDGFVHDGVVPPASAVGAYAWPLDPAVVVAPWVAPASPYGPGHRGVDLQVAPGAPVRGMGAGTVGFAGVVVGRAWVSVDHAEGVRTTVGPLATIAVEAGDAVAPNTVLGAAAGTAHADAARPRTGRLHVSARVDGTYVDPTPLVGRLVATLLPSG